MERFENARWSNSSTLREVMLLHEGASGEIGMIAARDGAACPYAEQ